MFFKKRKRENQCLESPGPSGVPGGLPSHWELIPAPGFPAFSLAPCSGGLCAVCYVWVGVLLPPSSGGLDTGSGPRGV